MRVKPAVSSDERLDEIDDMLIIQKPKGFCFGTDSVLLAEFASSCKEGEALDIGAGSGALPLMMVANGFMGTITALEVQENYADLARRNMELNGLSDRVTVVAGNIVGAHKILGVNRFDMIITNPPYGKKNGSYVSASDEKAIARHEIMCDLSEIAEESKKLLKNLGRIFVSHKAHRATELFATLESAGLRVKRIRYAHPRPGASAEIALCEAVKNGKQSVVVEYPVIISERAETKSER